MLYQSKIKHQVRDAAGKLKTFTEHFLYDAVSFSDVEKQVYEIVEGRLKDFSVKAITEVNYAEVYDTFNQGDFFKVTVVSEIGEGKTQTDYHLVAAADVTDAEKRAEAHMKNWLPSFTIPSVSKSPILGYWHPNAEPWQQDFKQRMEVLRENGHESADINQMELAFDRA